MISFIQHGCRNATIRCEFCKIDAANSVCAVTQPISDKRFRLEGEIEGTWEMLREQSVKAAARAEQTMLSVRTVLDLSHDLGSVKRHFMASCEDLVKAHDLSERSHWWDLSQDLRAKELRDYWRMNLLPREIQLSRESNRVFTSIDRELEEPYLSPKKKRVFVTTSRDKSIGDKWDFDIPSRSYEVWTLLCWRNENKWLYDFVVPQKFFSQQFSLAKKSLKKNEKIPVTVTRVDGDHFNLEIAGQTCRNIDELKSNYEPLK
jgi:tryptophanyl-tRNA synthetase